MWAIIVFKWSKREFSGAESLNSRQEYLLGSLPLADFGRRRRLGTSLANAKYLKRRNTRRKGIEFYLGKGH